MQDYPSRDALAAVMRLRLQQHSAPKKTSRLKRIILIERAEKAVAEAAANLQAAAEAAASTLTHYREVAGRLQVPLRDLLADKSWDMPERSWSNSGDKQPSLGPLRAMTLLAPRGPSPCVACGLQADGTALGYTRAVRSTAQQEAESGLPCGAAAAALTALPCTAIQAHWLLQSQAERAVLQDCPARHLSSCTDQQQGNTRCCEVRCPADHVTKQQREGRLNAQA